MTLLAVVRDVCAAVGVALPSSVFTNLTANRTMQEMVALADEMAQRIAYDLRDWTVLRTTATYVGDGVTTSFALPADFKRMLLTSNVWRSTSTQEPMMFVSDVDEWVRRRSFNESGAWGEWILMGGRLHIAPAMGVGVSARHSYLDKNCIALASGGLSDRFTDDVDSFRLDERLLKLGMIWQWKALKGSPYAEDMGTYSDALANMMGRDSPSPIIVDNLPISRAVRVSGSWPATWGPQP